MKGYKKFIFGAAILGLSLMPCYGLAKTPYKVDPAKVEKVEKHLKEKTLLNLGVIQTGDVYDLDDIRTGAIFYFDGTGDEQEGLVVALSQKGEIAYLFTGNSDIELFDHKDNGYGQVDALILYDGNQLKEIKDLSGEATEIVNKIYGLVLDEYEKLAIKRHVDTERFKQVGKQLDELIEDLKAEVF